MGCGYSLCDTWTDVSFADIIGLCFITPYTITQTTIRGPIRGIQKVKSKSQHSGYLSDTLVNRSTDLPSDEDVRIPQKATELKMRLGT